VIRGLRVPVHLSSRDALRIFDLADIWAARTGNTVRLVSANDHVHSRGSAHYAGLALDLHASDHDGLAAVLGRAGYRVLWNMPGHYAHVHVEYDGPSLPQPRAIVPVRLTRNEVAAEH
jgi:hypothetical protein